MIKSNLPPAETDEKRDYNWGCIGVIAIPVLFALYVFAADYYGEYQIKKQKEARLQEQQQLRQGLEKMKAARGPMVTYTKKDPIYSEDINSDHVRLSIDLELFEPNDYEVQKLIDKQKEEGQGKFELWSSDLLGAGEGDSSAFVIVRVNGSNIAYTDAVQRDAFFGRKVGISVDVPRKHVGKEINVEIWDDDSDEQGLATFIKSWKVKGNIGAGAEGNVGVPVVGNVGLNARASGTVEFDFNKFSEVMKNEDDLIVSCDFKLVEEFLIESVALFMPVKITKKELGEKLTGEGVERLVLETTAKGYLVESVGMIYFPCGKVKVDLILPKAN